MRAKRFERAAVALTIAFAAIASLFVGPATAGKAASKSGWKQFRSDRTKLYEKLAPAFVSCFKRRDSLIDPLSPIFHGCLDWHSAVHAAYAHHAVYLRTGKREYLDLAQDQIAPGGVSLIPAEMAYEQAKGADLPLTENPYGFGWFLVLARERELSTKEKDFRDMAGYAADQLVAWFRERITTGDARDYILDTTHPNYSWSLINLDVWARHTKDKALLEDVQTFSKPLFERSLDELCPVERDVSPNAGGFQPACLMRLAAAAQIWGGKVEKWVTARLPKNLHIPPVTEPSSCHAGGLNFTRAFALYELYSLTGRKSYRNNYAKLVRYHVGRPDLYIDESYIGDPGYLCYSHWVAQVGVRAISLSYDKAPSAPRAAPPIHKS